MKAKTVNENINFERGQDPKSAMGIGWDLDKYIEEGLKKRGHADVNFCDEFYLNMREMYDKEDLLEMLVDMVYKTKPEDQLKWVDSFLAHYDTYP